VVRSLKASELHSSYFPHVFGRFRLGSLRKVCVNTSAIHCYNFRLSYILVFVRYSCKNVIWLTNLSVMALTSLPFISSAIHVTDQYT